MTARIDYYVMKLKKGTFAAVVPQLVLLYFNAHFEMRFIKCVEIILYAFRLQRIMSIAKVYRILSAHFIFSIFHKPRLCVGFASLFCHWKADFWRSQAYQNIF